jgi:hypothetical protein
MITLPVTKKAHDLIEQFLHDAHSGQIVIAFRTKTRYFNKMIHYMQKKMRETCQTIDGKSEVIF